MKYSPKYNRMCELYIKFAKIDEKLSFSRDFLDFSDKAKKEMFLYESKGKGDLSIGLFSNHINGFFFGKRMLDITVAMWLEDRFNGILFEGQLYKEYPDWWLDSIFEHKKDKHKNFIGFNTNG